MEELASFYSLSVYSNAAAQIDVYRSNVCARKKSSANVFIALKRRIWKSQSEAKLKCDSHGCKFKAMPCVSFTRVTWTTSLSFRGFAHFIMHTGCFFAQQHLPSPKITFEIHFFGVNDGDAWDTNAIEIRLIYKFLLFTATPHTTQPILRIDFSSATLVLVGGCSSALNEMCT